MATRVAGARLPCVTENEGACEVPENPIPSFAPHLAPPVTREPIRSASDTGDGAELAYTVNVPGFPAGIFADDDAE
jgi:hypothetical protein